MGFMFEGIQNKRVLITGATGGMGTAMAELFADYGARIGLHYQKNQAKAEQLLAKILAKTDKTHSPPAGGSERAEIFRANLLEARAIQQLAEAFKNKFGGIDVLINNAGAQFDHTDFRALDDATWQKTFDLNAKAPFYLSGEVFDSMKNNGGGRIINVSSINVKYGGGPKSMHYVASKAALESITRGFAKIGAEHNILVNAIRPGVIDTPMHTRIAGYSEKDFEKRIALIPLKRTGTPMDIAQMALFLASETGNFITGEIFTVAGGD